MRKIFKEHTRNACLVTLEEKRHSYIEEQDDMAVQWVSCRFVRSFFDKFLVYSNLKAATECDMA